MLTKTNGSKVFDTLMFGEPLVVGEFDVVVVTAAADETVELLVDSDSIVDVEKP
jgi:hypothetical protein